ncbi:SGNH/GDSL hydrolase family protein [Acinetobacter dispersus]|uniref:SGNH/GDSL hydrolase family protein n=1 Tax=Acinetobacter dispersus TaxID=70348 RepID=UPI00132EF0EA|nr:SGNH/GDSL hydrolase family protein [Acinetobacter dispersus]MCH7382619.1 SGNH/GDSL hydrolase family protein [Acinetobacter dispersus]QHH96383.1 SGNH/GDSL hydrolase family protein [Acinetobacter dispersus]
MNSRTKSLVSIALTVVVMAGGSTLLSKSALAEDMSSWVATWQASPQPVWGTDFLFPTNLPVSLHDQTVRQIARISVGGKRFRIVLSNTYGQQPIIIGKATIARPQQDGAMSVDGLQMVTFSGKAGVTIAAGASVISDPVPLTLPALAQMAVSIYLPNQTPISTFHWDGRQTGWIVAGDQTASSTFKGVDVMTSTTARPLLTDIQVEIAQSTPLVVVMGDSITDGATASLDQDKRWPDYLAKRLVPHGVAVVNAGISGGRLLSDGMGMNALARLDRDVLAQPGVSSMIIMLGINDISWPGTAFAKTSKKPTLEALTAGYSQLVAQAHIRGVRVIAATLTPFKGALPKTPLDNYYQQDKENLRQQVNDWIRHSGVFDAVIDFDAVIRDPQKPTQIAARFDSGDHLHLGDVGNHAMAEAVDLHAVLPELKAVQNKFPKVLTEH